MVHSQLRPDGKTLEKRRLDTRLLCRFKDPCSNFSPIGYQERLQVLHLHRLQASDANRLCKYRSETCRDDKRQQISLLA